MKHADCHSVKGHACEHTIEKTLRTYIYVNIIYIADYH